MAKFITKEDCEKLLEEWDNYCEDIEQHQIQAAIAYRFKISRTIDDIDTISQNELRAMFRVTLHLMREDYSDYLD